MMEEGHIGPDSEKKAAELLDEHNPDLAIVTFHRIGKVAMIDFRAAEDGKEAKALLIAEAGRGPPSSGGLPTYRLPAEPMRPPWRVQKGNDVRRLYQHGFHLL